MSSRESIKSSHMERLAVVYIRQSSAYSGRRRPPIPIEGDHPFRSKATTDSGAKATTLS